MQGLRPACTAVAAALVLVLVAGCGSQLTVFDEAPPRPQQAAREAIVIPLEGQRRTTGIILANALSYALREAGYPARMASIADGRNPVIRGTITDVEDRGTIVWVVIDWTVYGPGGNALGGHRTEMVVSRDLWTDTAPEAISFIVTEAVPGLDPVLREAFAGSVPAPATAGPAPQMHAEPETAAMPQETVVVSGEGLSVIGGETVAAEEGLDDAAAADTGPSQQAPPPSALQEGRDEPAGAGTAGMASAAGMTAEPEVLADGETIGAGAVGREFDASLAETLGLPPPEHAGTAGGADAPAMTDMTGAAGTPAPKASESPETPADMDLSEDDLALLGLAEPYDKGAVEGGGSAAGAQDSSDSSMAMANVPATDLPAGDAPAVTVSGGETVGEEPDGMVAPPLPKELLTPPGGGERATAPTGTAEVAEAAEAAAGAGNEADTMSSDDLFASFGEEVAADPVGPLDGPAAAPAASESGVAPPGDAGPIASAGQAMESAAGAEGEPLPGAMPEPLPDDLTAPPQDPDAGPGPEVVAVPDDPPPPPDPSKDAPWFEMANAPPEPAPGTPTGETEAVQQGPVFLVHRIQGAPGNGDIALTEAMRQALREADAAVTDRPNDATHVIQGSVRVDPPFAGRQRTRIVWLVTTIDGQEVGTAMQENAVKQGRLDGEWGPLAGVIAEAALQGIGKLFDTALGAGPSTAGKLGEPDLPHVGQTGGGQPGGDQTGNGQAAAGGASAVP